MYWQTVGMTVTSCWTISMNVEVSLRFHPERVLNLNGIAIGGSHLVEKYFLKLKGFRRIATRYDKLAATYLGFICIASIL